MKMRLQKYLSQHGIASRRKAEKFIQNGWVSVNGIPVTTTVTFVNPEHDIVELSEAAQREIDTFTVIAFHKPRDIITHSKQHGETEIIDLLPPNYRHLHPIGRLDKASEGLILLTNHGVFATQFLNTDHPHPRTYMVTLAHPLTPAQHHQLCNGVDIGDVITLPCAVIQHTARRIEMTLYEGKNRQIRRMVQAVGNRVHRLIRTHFGPFALGKLGVGDYRVLSHQDIARVLPPSLKLSKTD